MDEDTKFKPIKDTFYLLIPIVAIAGLLIPLSLGMYNLVLLGSYLAIPMLAGWIIYNLYGRSPSRISMLDDRLFRLFLSIYFIIFSISGWLLVSNDLRTIPYYICITIVSTVVLAEIIFFKLSNLRLAVILTQIAFLNLNILWGVNLKYYYFIGRTDLIVHNFYIKSLLSEGRVTDLFDVYKGFPLWHIFVSSSYQILGLDIPPRTIMFILNGLIYTSLSVITYIVVKKMLEDDVLALLTSLFISVNPDVIYYGMYSIPRSVASVIEVLLLVCLFSRSEPKKLALSLFLIPVLVLYHPVSSPFVLLIFGLITLFIFGLTNIRNEYVLSPRYLFFGLTFSLVYWIYNADYIFKSIVQNIIASAPSGFFTKSIKYAPVDELFNYLQYIPILLFIIFGILFVLSSKKISDLCKVSCLIGILSAALAFPGPMILISKISKQFNFVRFGEYSFFFISMLAAIGFLALFNRLNNRMRCFILILFFVMVFLTVSNDFTASDNPIVKRSFYTFYLTKSENSALDQALSIAHGPIMSDYISTRYFSASTNSNKSQILEVDKKHESFLKGSNGDLILIRTEELKKRPLKLYTSSTEEFRLDPSWGMKIDYYYNNLPLWDTLSNYNEIYNSPTVSIYI